MDKKQRDPDRAVVDSIESHPIAVLQSWAARAKEMEPTSSPRMKTLTGDTAKALHWTCRCLVDLCSHLLNVESPIRHNYVPLGFFQQDDIEKHFAHFRMSAGCNYYITVEDVQHTHAADRARLMLEATE
ncbi:group XV phospholipase A2, partial [Elysia marginata]